MTTPSRKARSGHSKRQAIRSVIIRRLAACESLAIRQIILEAGGGSTDTVREELARLDATDTRIAEVLTGHSMRNRSEEISVLRTALDESLQREATLRAEASVLRADASALREAVDATNQTIQYLIAHHEDTYRLMVTDIDLFRGAARAVPEIRAAAERAEQLAKERVTAATKIEVIPDLVIEGKYRLQVTENARLHRRLREMEEQLASLQQEQSSQTTAAPAAIKDDEFFDA